MPDGRARRGPLHGRDARTTQTAARGAGRYTGETPVPRGRPREARAATSRAAC